MKIYFTSNRPKTINPHLEVIKWLKKNKHQVKNELIPETTQSLKVDDFDLVILEIDKNDKTIYQIIFEALLHQKPVLLLYKYHSRRPHNLNFKLEEKILKNLTIKGYVPIHLPQILEKFFFDMEKGIAERFNFFITKDIEDYLNWIPYGIAKTRSDFIRGLIRDQMKKDKKYNARSTKTIKH